MPAYNAERYLAPAVESVLAQSFADFELFILDDGSSDGTGAILAQFARRDSRIRVFTRSHVGLTRALNEMLAAANGEYVARMDADDVCLPKRLAVEVAYLDAHTEVGLVSGNYFIIDAAGKVVGGLGRSQGLTGAQVEWALYWENPIVHPSVMFRTALVRECGGYPEGHLHYADDYHLWFTLLALTKIVVLHEPLLLLRKHDQNVTSAPNGGHLEDVIRTAQTALAARIGYQPSDHSVRIARQSPADGIYSRADLDAGLRLLLSAHEGLVRRGQIAARELEFVDADLRTRILGLIDLYAEGMSPGGLATLSAGQLSRILAHKIARGLRRRLARFGLKARKSSL
jgi:glycosyltransferase involved in cell wall biosynthesis